MAAPARAATPLSVIELRNYLLADTSRAFIRYFEEEFLFSQRDTGMHPLGQFAVTGAADRFVWIRGFEDMRVRRHGLEAFYGGLFWQARRDQANALMREHHDVHLLRPLSPVAALTAGAALEARASQPPGVVSPDAGWVRADFYRTEPAALGRLVELFEHRARPLLGGPGHQLLGYLVAEPTPNDYPRLPVIQDPSLLVVLSAGRDREPQTAAALVAAALSPLLTAEVTTLRLQPTARSLVRYHDAGAPARPA
jgi:hypothetical protein